MGVWFSGRTFAQHAEALDLIYSIPQKRGVWETEIKKEEKAGRGGGVR